MMGYVLRPKECCEALHLLERLCPSEPGRGWELVCMFRYSLPSAALCADGRQPRLVPRATVVAPCHLLVSPAIPLGVK